jgi:hypothetical protein
VAHAGIGLVIHKIPGKPISMGEYIQELRALGVLKEALEGPLTEYEYSDGDDDGEPTIRAARDQGDSKRCPGRRASDTGPLLHKDKQSGRNSARRRRKRAQEGGSGDGMGHCNVD